MNFSNLGYFRTATNLTMNTTSPRHYKRGCFKYSQTWANDRSIQEVLLKKFKCAKMILLKKSFYLF